MIDLYGIKIGYNCDIVWNKRGDRFSEVYVYMYNHFENIYKSDNYFGVSMYIGEDQIDWNKTALQLIKDNNITNFYIKGKDEPVVIDRTNIMLGKGISSLSGDFTKSEYVDFERTLKQLFECKGKAREINNWIEFNEFLFDTATSDEYEDLLELQWNGKDIYNENGRISYFEEVEDSFNVRLNILRSR